MDEDVLDKIREQGLLLARLLIKSKLTLSVAESCTGGLVASSIVAQAGVSEFFKGGLVAYWNEIKQELLAVPVDVLRLKGAVSAECAKAMAEGVRETFKSDIALSTTGIAGPDGGTPEKPVGTVWIGVALKSGTNANCYHFDGDRSNVRLMACYMSLQLLTEFVKAC